MSKQRSPSHFGFTKIIAKKMTVELCYIYFEEGRKVSVAFVLSKLLNFSFNHFNVFPFFHKIAHKSFHEFIIFWWKITRLIIFTTIYKKILILRGRLQMSLLILSLQAPTSQNGQTHSLLPTNWLSVFDHFMEGLSKFKQIDKLLLP